MYVLYVKTTLNFSANKLLLVVQICNEGMRQGATFDTLDQLDVII